MTKGDKDDDEEEEGNAGEKTKDKEAGGSPMSLGVSRWVGSAGGSLFSCKR